MNIVEPLDVGGPAFFRNEVFGNAPVSMSGAAINESQATDVASASTIDLDTTTGNLVDVTGTTTITAITLSQGRERVVRFTGALTLTHGASLVLPGSANITTAAGDFAIFRGYASSVVRCVMYQKIAGTSVVADVSAATQAEQETGTATTVYVTPGRQQYHPSAPKAWINFNGTGTPAARASYNVTSITDNGTGNYTLNLTTAFSSANYAGNVSASNVTTGAGTLTATEAQLRDYATGSIRAITFEAGSLTDEPIICVSLFGDQ